MGTHAEKTEQKDNLSINNVAVHQRNTSTFAFQFTDNRPEAIVQRKHQQLADNSPQVAQLQAFQAMADNYSVQPQPIQRQASPERNQRGSSTGLPDNLKTGVENLSGYSMDDVKVHYNSSKPAQLQAHAYTQRTDIHVAPGQEQHLPHEAWHVVQQKQGRVKPTLQMKGKVNINDDAGLEKEADVMGSKAAQAGSLRLPVNLTNRMQQRVAKFQVQGIIQKWDEGHKTRKAMENHSLECVDNGLYKIWYRRGYHPTELIISSHGFYVDGSDEDCDYGVDVSFYGKHGQSTTKNVNDVMEKKGKARETLWRGFNYILSCYHYGGTNPDMLDSLMWLGETYGVIGKDIKKSRRRKNTYAVLTINQGKYIEYSKLKEDGALDNYDVVHAAHCRKKHTGVTYDQLVERGLLNQ